MILPTGSSSSNSTKGFTIVEIILVVIVLTILASLSIPNFRNTFTSLQLQNTTQDIVSLMRYAQSRAITQGARVRLIFGSEFQNYWLVQEFAIDSAEGEFGESEDDSNFQRFSGRWGRMFDIPPELRFDTPVSFVEFFPDGRISKERIKICRKDKCYAISTKEQRGYIQLIKPS